MHLPSFSEIEDYINPGGYTLWEILQLNQPNHLMGPCA